MIQLKKKCAGEAKKPQTFFTALEKKRFKKGNFSIVHLKFLKMVVMVEDRSKVTDKSFVIWYDIRLPINF